MIARYPSLRNNLETLKRDGRLTVEVLEGLKRLADPDFPLAEGIDRAELVKQAAKDIADPTEIRQGRRGTCAETAAQISLAIRRPERYLAILAALASESGDASEFVPGPPPLCRAEDTPIEKPEGDGRTITVRLMNAAFNEFANSSIREGLYPEESLRLEERIVGVPSYNLDTEHVPPEFIIGELESALARGQAVPVSLRWRTPDGGHRVVLTRIGTDPQDGSKCAYFVNPHGHLQKVPLGIFSRLLKSASLPEVENPPVELTRKISEWSAYRPLKDIYYRNIIEEDPGE
jgi:hypothetical protein